MKERGPSKDSDQNNNTGNGGGSSPATIPEEKKSPFP